jgi:hypothetical protein
MEPSPGRPAWGTAGPSPAGCGGATARTSGLPNNAARACLAAAPNKPDSSLKRTSSFRGWTLTSIVPGCTSRKTAKMGNRPTGKSCA